MASLQYSTLWSFLRLVVMALIIASTSGTTDMRFSRRNQDLVAATEEMQRANYFTYVMLINMAAPAAEDLMFQAGNNVTFLMPNDRTLAKTVFPENGVADFLLLHSIPSALLFEHMLHFPTNSMIPTSNPNASVLLRVSNDGRRRFFLNNVRIISPNICTAGSSIRCHGIDGALVLLADDHNISCSSSSSSINNNDTIPSVAIAPAPLPEPAPPAPAPAAVDVRGINLSSPSTVPHQKSSGGSSDHFLSRGRRRLSIEFAMTLMTLLAL